MKSRIHLVRTGPRGGRPVVLLHPVGLDLTYWGDYIAALGNDHDVVAVDLPGQGRSPGTAAEWTLPRATRTLLETITDLDAAAVDLVGLSVGGMLAQAITVTAPALVHSLTLLDTAAAFPEQGRTLMRERAAATRADGMAAVVPSTVARWFTADTVARRPDLVDRVTTTLLADDPLVHAAMWDMIAELDLVDRLPEIGCPTLVMVGEHDSSSPVAAARQLRDGIPRAQLTVVPHAAHLAPLEQPEIVNTRLAAFLMSTH